MKLHAIIALVGSKKNSIINLWKLMAVSLNQHSSIASQICDVMERTWQKIFQMVKIKVENISVRIVFIQAMKIY